MITYPSAFVNIWSMQMKAFSESVEQMYPKLQHHPSPQSTGCEPHRPTCRDAKMCADATQAKIAKDNGYNMVCVLSSV